jgi:heme-degrading monooxygenase HmoA
MYVAMNRFKINLGYEQEFINVWKNRDSYLETVSGFQSFNLLRGESNEAYTLFASHAIWDSREDFVKWTQSDAFRKAHANARSNKEMYVCGPNFEGFEACL